MKRVIAFILLILYVGNVAGMMVNACTVQGNTQSLRQSVIEYNYLKNNDGIPANCCDDELHLNKLFTLHNHVTATGKMKMRNAAFSPVLLTAFLKLLPANVHRDLLLNILQPVTTSTPVFLRNRVLRL